MKYKSKYLIKLGDKGELKAGDVAKIINKAKEQQEKNEFWKYAWVPMLIAFALVAIMLLPK